MVKAPVEDLETYLLIVREASREKIPEVEELSDKLASVDYQQRLSILKQHNLLGTTLTKLAGDGHKEHIRCIIQSIEPNDRFGVYRLTDNGSCTLIHHAAYHGNSEVIQMVLASLSSDERFQLLLFVDVSAMTALDYAAHNGNVVDRAVSEALLRQLTLVQKRELVDCSQVFQRAADEKDIDCLLADQPLLDVNQKDEAAPPVATVGEPPMSLKENVASPMEELRRENRFLKKLAEQQAEQIATLNREFAVFRRRATDPENGALVCLHQSVQDMSSRQQWLESQVEELQAFKAEMEAQDLERKLREMQRMLDGFNTNWDEEFFQEPEGAMALDPEAVDAKETMEKRFQRIEDCLMKLCHRINDLRFRCKFLKNGTAESAKRNSSADDTTTQAEQCCCSRSSSITSASDAGSLDVDNLQGERALSIDELSASEIQRSGDAAQT